MKQSRRHDLKTNELADFLRQLKEWFNTYGNYVIGGAAIVILVVGGASYYSRSRTARVQQNWVEYQDIDREFNRAAAAMQQARVPAARLKEQVQVLFPRMEQLANASDDQALICQAWQWIGDRRLTQASMVTNQKELADTLDSAEKAYRRVIGAGPDRTFEVLAAKFGLASVHESKRDFSEAQRIYQEIAGLESPQTEVHRKLAADKLKELARISVPVVLADPPPASRPATQPATTTRPAGKPKAPSTQPAQKTTTRPTSRRAK